MNELIIVFKDHARGSITLAGKQVGCTVIDAVTYKCFANADGVDRTVYVPIAEVQYITIKIV